MFLSTCTDNQGSSVNHKAFETMEDAAIYNCRLAIKLAKALNEDINDEDAESIIDDMEEFYDDKNYDACLAEAMSQYDEFTLSIDELSVHAKGEGVTIPEGEMPTIHSS